MFSVSIKSSGLVDYFVQAWELYLSTVWYYVTFLPMNCIHWSFLSLGSVRISTS